MKEKIQVVAKLIDKNSGHPISGDGTVVKLYDRDIITDDFLGECKVSEDGAIKISFLPSDFSSQQTFGEKFPDLYFTVFKYGALLYKSKVMHNFNLDDPSHVNTEEGKLVDFGTIQI
jgi:hypothetical protein